MCVIKRISIVSLRFWSTSVDSLSALTAEPSLAYRTLGCAMLLVDRLLSFSNAFVSFQISFIAPDC